ncbi:GTP pyrophosphokinase [Actinomadura alba]|uniref:RelA/SpoT domain-containing protein n=1 Tax=Actinomadura alba TaxID=406431 RepID=A0ABR7LXC9_9ACTN|nr:hypothetical protein [Actinomadura alba]MBC6469105.1 hypothetical protein [Actinomadura alba]
MADQIDPYEVRSAQLHAFGPILENLVRRLLETSGLRAHSVGHRVKSRTSAHGKLTRKSNHKYRSINDLHDLLGLRIITYFSDEVDEVARLIESEFSIDYGNSIDKRAILDPDRFGYLSTHYIGSLDERRCELIEYSRFKDIAFEIQIRSILQHAWAEIEHDIGYKSPVSIPRDFKRRFSRLAGLLEIADHEFAEIRRSLEQNASELSATISAGGDVEINQDSIYAFIRQSKILHEIDQAIIDGCSAQRQEIGRSYAGVQASNLRKIGLNNVHELEAELHDRRSTIIPFAIKWLKTPTLPPYEDIDADDFDTLIESSTEAPDSLYEEEPDLDFDVEMAERTGVWSQLPSGISLYYLTLDSELRHTDPTNVESEMEAIYWQTVNENDN